MNLPIPRNTVKEMARKRNLALDAYATAYEALTLAAEAEKAAHLARHASAPMKKDGRYSYHLAETMAVVLAHPDIDISDLKLEPRGRSWD